MELFYVIVLLFFIATFYLVSLKDSVFGISFQKGHYAGFFVFYTFLVFIAPSAILLNIYPIEHFWVAFKVKQEVVFWVTVVVLLSYMFFIANLWFIKRLFPKRFIFEYPELSNADKITYRKFVYCSVFFAISLMVLAWFRGAEHSFMSSVISGQGVSQSRMELKSSQFTKFLGYFFSILCPLLMAIVASPVFKNQLISRAAMVVSIFIVVTWSGNKGPVLSLLLIYFACILTFSKVRFGVQFLLKSLLVSALLLFFTYRVVLLQYPQLIEWHKFLDYFYQRVFVAQMIGVYEQFSLDIRNSMYFLHGVPFASFFVDFPVFQKDLMMISEDRVDPGSIGIKNTFFIAEAYAMGGWLFIIPAIFIFSLNYVVSFVVMVGALNLCLAKNSGFNKLISAIVLFSYVGVTGGFSDLMLFKVTIMILILLFPVLFIGYLSRYKFVMKRTVSRTPDSL